MSPFRRFSFWAAIIASFVLTILASLIIAEIYQDPLASINPTEFSDTKIEFYFNKTKAYAGVCSSGVKNFISTFDPDCLDHYVGALEKFCREPKIVDAMNMEMKRCLDKNDFENI